MAVTKIIETDENDEIKAEKIIKGADFGEDILDDEAKLVMGQKTPIIGKVELVEEEMTFNQTNQEQNIEPRSIEKIKEVVIEEFVENNNSPIITVLNKSKKEKITINLELELELPDLNLLKTMCNSLDEKIPDILQILLKDYKVPITELVKTVENEINK